MEVMALQVGVSADRQHVVVQLLRNGENLGGLAMDAAETEGHISLLARTRQTLIEQVPEAPDPNARMEIAANNPATAVGTATAVPGTVFLRIRHPGMGWLTFGLSQDQAKDLAANLLSYADPASP